MEQAFDSVPQPDKGAKVFKLDNRPLEDIPVAHLIAKLDKGIGCQVFKRKPDPLGLGIHLDNPDPDGLLGIDDVAWIDSAFPCQIIQPDQAIKSADIDKHAAFCDIADNTLDLITNLIARKNLVCLLLTLGFEKLAP